MKILALVSLLALCAAPQAASTATRAQHECGAIAWVGHGVDDPPPLECPMCGGNIELHRKRTKQMAFVRATSLLAWMTIH